MKIYIASSWKNQHGVEMLTALLRERGHEVISWVENNGATTSDLVIYYAPSGKDACAELGAAWAAGVLIIGLYAKGEDLGLMRKMVNTWCQRYTEVLQVVDEVTKIRNKVA